MQIATNVIFDTRELNASLNTIPIPDIIFLDLEMPFINGYDVLDYIRQDSNLSQVPIVAYTTHTSHMNTAHQAGFHSFLGKPLDSTLFPDQIHRILNGEHVWEVP
jgi:two-component system cell cycle response regulator DivK